jgi:hypothetical protein
MTFEEIREMVNATITENGQRQITGKALNLALLEIITAMEENKPEGGGAETVYIEETLTPEHQAANAATYAKCKANVAEDKALPAIVLDVTQLMEQAIGASLGGVKVSFPLEEIIFADPSSDFAAGQGASGLMMGFLDPSGDKASIIVNEDGSITAMR